MDAQYIDCQVVMLPTEKEGANICKSITNGKFSFHNTLPFTNMLKPQHLYFTSDEEIKGDDWCIAFGGVVRHLVGTNTLLEGSKKIVASTDPSLGLPIIPRSFLEHYTTTNGRIDKVKLEVYFDGPESVHKPENALIRLTANNEVIVMDEPKYTSRADAYEAALYKQENTNSLIKDKELEDAAKIHADNSVLFDDNGVYNRLKDAFRAGWEAYEKHLKDRK